MCDEKNYETAKLLKNEKKCMCDEKNYETANLFKNEKIMHVPRKEL